MKMKNEDGIWVGKEVVDSTMKGI